MANRTVAGQCDWLLEQFLTGAAGHFVQGQVFPISVVDFAPGDLDLGPSGRHSTILNLPIF